MTLAIHERCAFTPVVSQNTGEVCLCLFLCSFYVPPVRGTMGGELLRGHVRVFETHLLVPKWTTAARREFSW